ncbi:MAG: hypothetical protein C0599_13585 [Salinivirgaceae bacterium]|nr:MAG: hypothetical protein C0599_13585 [Salinivirgaceae bacterium]
MDLKNQPLFIPGNTITLADSFLNNSNENIINALFEMDLTEIRKAIKERQHKGNNISTSAWIVKLFTSAISDQVLHQYPKTIHYDMWLEKRISNNFFAVPITVSDANNKSIEELSMQIGIAKGTITKERGLLKLKNQKSWLNQLISLPHFLRKKAWRFFLKNPHKVFSKVGNSAFSYISTTGIYKDTKDTLDNHHIQMAIGTMFQKQRFIDYELKTRDIVPVSIQIDKRWLGNQDLDFFLKDISRHINNNAAFFN